MVRRLPCLRLGPSTKARPELVTAECDAGSCVLLGRCFLSWEAALSLISPLMQKFLRQQNLMQPATNERKRVGRRKAVGNPDQAGGPSTVFEVTSPCRLVQPMMHQQEEWRGKRGFSGRTALFDKARRSREKRREMPTKP